MDKVRVDRFQGVYFIEHASRKHNGKTDRSFYITYKAPVGKKFWGKVGWASEGYTAQMAAQDRAERIRTMRHGEELPQKKTTNDVILFGTLWEKYAAWAKHNTKAFDREENRYNKHLKQRLDKMPVDNISPFLLEGIKNDLLKQGKAPATAKLVLTLFRQVLNKGISWGLWKGENPVKAVKIPKMNNKRERFLTKDKAQSLLEEHAKISPQWHYIVLLSLHTGMRAGEIFALKAGHANLEEGIINIQDPKPGESQKVYMIQTIKSMLTDRLAGLGPEEWVFKTREGKQINEVSDTFHRVVMRLGFNTGVEDRRHTVCFHTLRHTFASWFALEGTPILTIKELMRHSSLAMTERYSHLIPDHKRQAITIIDGKMKGESGPKEISAHRLIGQ